MRRGIGRAAGILCVALAVHGCGDDTATREEGRATPGGEEGTRAVTPALYVTDLTFAPFRPSPRGLHYRFRHTTSAEQLARSYGGWRYSADRWEPRLEVRDSLPVPRAGWRVLPTGDLRIVVDDEGELRTLAQRDGGAPGGDGTPAEAGERPVRLDADRTLAEWSSPTGQRERMRLAFLDSAGSRVPGILVERRSARPLDTPPPRGMYGFWLVTDSAGNGLVLLRQAGTPAGRRPAAVDSTVTVHGWVAGEERMWRGAQVERLGPSDTTGAVPVPPEEGWEVRMGDGDLEGRLRPGPLVRTDASGEARVYALEGTLRIQGRPRRVGGIAVESGTP
jgi:hypothetical protein